MAMFQVAECALDEDFSTDEATLGGRHIGFGDDLDRDLFFVATADSTADGGKSARADFFFDFVM